MHCAVAATPKPNQFKLRRQPTVQIRVLAPAYPYPHTQIQGFKLRRPHQETPLKQAPSYIPGYRKSAFAICLGYPVSTPAKYLRVRRDADAFVHDNRFGNRWSEPLYTPSRLSKRAASHSKKKHPLHNRVAKSRV